MRCRIACLLVLSGCAASAASNWIRLTSPSVEILTDSKESTARAILDRFELLRAIFRETYPADPAAPLRVFVFASEHEYQTYRVTPTAAAFYHNGEDGDFIVLSEGAALKRNASHEYLHMVLRYSSAPLPRWLDEGLPEFYSTITLSGSKVRVGEPIEGHQRLLANSLWLSAEDLMLGDATDGPIFYAESWALVHMLSLAPEYQAHFPEFIKRLNEGVNQEDAFNASFKMPMDDAIAALRAYIRNPRSLSLPAPTIDQQTYQSTLMPPVEATIALADLAQHSNRPGLARSLYLRAAKENPQSPAAIAGLAALAMIEGRQEDAAREFERSIAMGSRDATTYFQLAQLRRDDSLLEKALTVDPNFAEAHFLLGVHASDRGDFPSALDHLRRATALQPRRFSFWNALGYAQAHAGDRPAAAESARRAAATATTPVEEQQAASLLLLASAEPAPSPAKKPAVITPPSWQNRKGGAHADGTLIQVDCGSIPVRLIVKTVAPGDVLELKVQNPADVNLVNADGASTMLVCGQQSLPVAVDYVADSREVTRIEFKRAVIIKR